VFTAFPNATTDLPHLLLHYSYEVDAIAAT
jgi:hypothetical protein